MYSVQCTCTAIVLYRVCTNLFGVKNWHVSVGKCTLGHELLTTSGVWYNMYKEVSIGTTSTGRITLIPSSNAAFSSSILVVSERQSKQVLTQPPTKSLLDFFSNALCPRAKRGQNFYVIQPIILFRARQATNRIHIHAIFALWSQQQTKNKNTTQLGIDCSGPLSLLKVSTRLHLSFSLK